MTSAASFRKWVGQFLGVMDRPPLLVGGGQFPLLMEGFFVAGGERHSDAAYIYSPETNQKMHKAVSSVTRLLILRKIIKINSWKVDAEHTKRGPLGHRGCLYLESPDYFNVFRLPQGWSREFDKQKLQIPFETCVDIAPPWRFWREVGLYK